MLWNYDCPECHRPTSVEWKQREAEAICRRCAKTHYPPTPHEDHDAYVDDVQWPQEIEETVVSIRGAICCVPGCYGEHATLIYRVPPSTGGRTSVENLMPACKHHGETRGSRPWDEWMAEARAELASQKKETPKFEVTITKHDIKPETHMTEFAAPPPGLMVPLATMRAPRPPKAPGAGQPLAELKLAVPFMRGPAGKLTFNYDWEMTKSGKSKVFLLAWPRGDEPDISLLGGPKYPGIQMTKDHLGVKDEKGNNEIELRLPETPGGRWTAAVAVLNESGDLHLTEYALSATK